LIQNILGHSPDIGHKKVVLERTKNEHVRICHLSVSLRVCTYSITHNLSNYLDTETNLNNRVAVTRVTKLFDKLVDILLSEYW